MVTPQKEDGLFYIQTEPQRLANIVSEHSVLELALCPASMYLECVAMAAQEVIGDIDDKSLWSEILSIEKSLGSTRLALCFYLWIAMRKDKSSLKRYRATLSKMPRKMQYCRDKAVTWEQMSRQWSIKRDQRTV